MDFNTPNVVDHISLSRVIGVFSGLRVISETSKLCFDSEKVKVWVHGTLTEKVYWTSFS